MWFWCQAFSLDLHLNDLFKSSNIKTCQQSSAQCAQHGKPHNLLFLYTRNEGLPAQSLNGCHFWEKISISQALTVHLPSNPPTYWFIFEAKIYSQWSVGETPAHFQEHFDIFPLKNVIMKLFWARKVIKNEQSRLRHKGVFSLSCIFAVCLIRGHTDPISLTGIRGTDSDHIIYLFILQQKIWRSSVFFTGYRGGAVVQKCPPIVSSHNWLINCLVLSPWLLPTFTGRHY